MLIESYAQAWYNRVDLGKEAWPMTGIAHQAEPRRYLYQSKGWKLLFNAVWLGAAVALLIPLTLAGLVLSRSVPFFSPLNLSNVAWIWLSHAILAPAIVLIVASGGLDLSIGAVIGLVGVVVATLAPIIGPGAAALVGTGLGLLTGLVNGLLAGATRVHGALVTLATATLLRGLALTLTLGTPVAVKDVGWLSSPAIPWIALLFAVLAGLGGALLLARRKAQSGDAAPSWIARLIFTGLPYVFSGLLAGLVGVIYLGRLRVGLPTGGAGFEVDELLIVLLGGTPLVSAAVGNTLVNIAGALLAALAVAVGQNGAVLAGAPPFAVELVKGVGLLVVGGVSYLYYLGVSLLPAARKKGEVLAKPGDAGVQT
jgi:ribose/xylose/arabinose/galactoside ABC-type transport system permease subunit